MSSYIPTKRSLYSPSAENNSNPRSLNRFHAILNESELACFRTLFCEAHQKGMCKNADSCPHSHCLTWQRRDPYIAHYSSKQCPDIEFVRKGSKMCLNRQCNRGRSCSYAHSKEEALYHPLMYKTKKCLTSFCKRFYCPFAHSEEELRKPFKIQSIRDIWGKADSNLPALNSPCQSSDFLESPSINSVWSSKLCSYSSVPQFGPLGSLVFDNKQCFMTPELTFSHSLGKSQSFLPSIEPKSLNKNSRRMSSADYLSVSCRSSMEDSRRNKNELDIIASPALASTVSDGGPQFFSHNLSNDFSDKFVSSFPNYPRNVSSDERALFGSSHTDSNFPANNFLSPQYLPEPCFNYDIEPSKQDEIVSLSTFSHPIRTGQNEAFPTLSLNHSITPQSEEGYSAIASLQNSLLNSLKLEPKTQDNIERNENLSENICRETGIIKNTFKGGTETDISELVANLLLNAQNGSETLTDKSKTLSSNLEWIMQFCTSLNGNGDSEDSNNTQILKHPSRKTVNVSTNHDSLHQIPNNSSCTLFSNEEWQSESPWLIDQFMVGPQRSSFLEYLRACSVNYNDPSSDSGTIPSFTASNPVETLVENTTGRSSDSCASTEVDDTKKETYPLVQGKNVFRKRHEIAGTCTTSPLACNAMYQSPLNTPINIAHDNDVSAVLSIKNEFLHQTVAKDSLGCVEIDARSRSDIKEKTKIALSQEMWNAVKSLSHSEATELVHQLDESMGPLAHSPFDFDDSTQTTSNLPTLHLRNDMQDFPTSFTSRYGNFDVCETSNQKTGCKITPLHAKARSDVESGISNHGSSELMSYFSSNASEHFRGDSDSDHSKGYSPSVESEKACMLSTNGAENCIAIARKEAQINGHGDDYDKLWEEICHGI